MNLLEELAPYMFDLPPELIAQAPPAVRGASRLMRLDRQAGLTSLHVFDQLDELLPPGALVVFNEVRVVPTRLLGRKTASGGALEAFILEPPPPSVPAGPLDLWCLVHPGRRLKPGAGLMFSRPDGPAALAAEVLEAAPDGRRLIRFHFDGPPLEILEEVGHVPLPFYIKRPDAPEDRLRYQTVYARTPGAAAAPTAGLHFSEAMLRRLESGGRPTARLTLKVSAGTFAPLTRAQLESGRLHREHVEVPEKTAEAARRAKKEGRPVVAVGTTTVRSLEWAAAAAGEVESQEGWVDLFIRPGYEFKAVDALLTNFHLPGSSLMMLAAALAGRENILAAYQKAIENGFRFYSYGDAMLII
ncbi:MAG: tRNA preQ1(34) S-adenosylmethionine ribosyltransferase-isomerase QueA [Candidatus Adiutrix sp.]|jgi:S-adenosylmethionine:tRNA ribosyltransferase-isomerase|nr:tRNA preQ1(34) S-adenosylmethionine ribosyltransferase-isomerase QueA [Candidatus Adiutrix sp.]